MVHSALRPLTLCKNSRPLRKNSPTYSFSRNAPFDGTSISSERIFIYLKTEQVKNLRGAQIGGYVWKVLHNIKSACYSVRNTSVGLVLARTECLDLDLSFCGAQTRPICLHPPVHPMLP
jgi:hypothetical protein